MPGYCVSRSLQFKARHSHRGLLQEKSHIHTYTLRISIKGKAGKEGFVCDFRILKRVIQNRILSRLHGANLDDLFSYPTAENIAVWVWKEMAFFFPLSKVEIREKPYAWVEFSG